MNCSTLPNGYRQIGGIDLLRDRRAALIVNIGALVIALLLVPLGLFWRPFFFPADSLFPGVRPAQQHRRFEEPNCVISTPTSDRMVIALLRSTPGIVRRSTM